jgi:hypothetical protein
MNDGCWRFATSLMIYESGDFTLPTRLVARWEPCVPRFTSTRGKVWTRGTFHGTMCLTGVQNRPEFKLSDCCTGVQPSASNRIYVVSPRSRNTISMSMATHCIHSSSSSSTCQTRAAMDFVETRQTGRKFRVGSHLYESLPCTMKR